MTTQPFLVRFSKSKAHTRIGEVNGIPYIEKYGKLFKSGVHRGRIYTERDLDRLVDNFRAPKDEVDWTVGVYKDHEISLDNLIGSVRSLERKGREVFGWLRFPTAEAIPKVQSGLWLKLSPGINYASMALEEVSVLPDPHFDDTQLFAKQTEEDSAVSKPTTKAQEEGKSSEDRPPEVNSVADKEQFANKMRELNDTWETRFKKQDELLAALLKEKDETKAELELFRSKQAELKAVSEVETFRAQGKTTKAMASEEAEFVKSLSAEQLDQYRKIKAAQPAFVDFEVYGKVELNHPESKEDSQKKVSKLVDKYGFNKKKQKEAE